MSMNEYLQYATGLGFTHAEYADRLAVQCRPDLRTFCNPDQCTSFGTSWVCPPGCGTLEECRERAAGFHSGIILQSVSQVPSGVGRRFKMKRLQRAHNLKFLKLAERVRNDGHTALPLTTGGCILCQTCTYPNEPCREPGRRFHSLSAYGIDVSALCGQVGLDFAFHNDSVTYVACLLL